MKMTEQDYLQKCPDDRNRKWYASLKDWNKASVRAFPPWECYRVDGEGHYRIHARGLDNDGVVYFMNHGRDSFWPGINVAGIRADQITLCGCGKWQWPTHEQVKNA